MRLKEIASLFMIKETQGNMDVVGDKIEDNETLLEWYHSCSKRKEENK